MMGEVAKKQKSKAAERRGAARQIGRKADRQRGSDAGGQRGIHAKR